VALELRDARHSGPDPEWLTNVFPFYLHDLSEFDVTYHTLDDRRVWMPDHRESWLQDDRDHPLILADGGRRVGFALVNQAPSPHMRPGMDYRMSEFFVPRKYRGLGIGRRAVFGLFWRRVIGEYSGGRYEESRDPGGVCQVIDTAR
jgi:predicted acetyltransferase